MTEQEAMQILADMGLHEGGMDNWVPDNAWYRFANVVEAKARADEREETDRLRALCYELLSELYVYRASKYLKDTTEAIRARGTT
jgi:hypothetical protein